MGANNKINVRKKASELLFELERENSYSDILLSNFIKSHSISVKDRKLITEIFYGTLRNLIRIDSIIRDNSAKKKKIDGFVKNVIRMSVYQIIFLDRVPDFAAIDEAVKIVKSSKKPFMAGFVNALLRNVSRKRADYLEEHEAGSAKEIEERFSFPLHLAEYFMKKWGADDLKAFLKYTLSPGPLTIRRTHLCDDKMLEDIFQREDVAFSKLKCKDDAYHITLKKSIDELESYKKGFFIVQSVPSSYIVKLLSLEEGDTVFDLCSAPGTKTVEISHLVGDTGHVLASDIHPRRLARVNENVNRFKLKNVSALSLDAAFPLPLKKGFLADKILLDVPCTGLGVVRKIPEIKYRITLDDMRRMSELQYAILENAAKYLKPGGKLVYSTCTMTSEENEDVVNKFLEQNSGFVLEKVKDTALIDKKMVDENGFFRTLPHLNDMDGFFAAVIVRRLG